MRKLTFSTFGQTTVTDYSVKATLILQCGTDMDIKVSYKKVYPTSYKTILISTTIQDELSFSHIWASSTPGYQYVEFQIQDHHVNAYSINTGFWMFVASPSAHDIEVRQHSISCYSIVQPTMV